MKRDECLTCDCSFSAGCKYDRPDAPKTRKYVMTKPRGRRGPSRTATQKGIAKLFAKVAERQKTLGERK